MHRKKIHIGIGALIVAVAVLVFFDLPLFAVAKDIRLQTPIVRQFKAVRRAAALSLSASAPVLAVAETATSSSPASTSTTEVKPVETPAVPSSEPSQLPPPPPQEEKKAPPPNLNNNEEEIVTELVDQREVKQALRDIKRMQSDIKRFLKQLKKLPNTADDVATCNNILSQLTEYYKSISQTKENESLREALQDFRDERLWEEVDKIRAKVELPKQLTQVEKELKQIKKKVAQKSYQNLGVNMDLLNQRIAEIETLYNDAKQKYQNGELQEAKESMDEIWREEGTGGPGEPMGLLDSLREVRNGIKKVRNAEIKAVMEEIINEIVATANEGYYREAFMSMQEIKDEFMKFISRYAKSNVLDEKMRDKIEKFEELIQQKMSSPGENNKAGG